MPVLDTWVDALTSPQLLSLLAPQRDRPVVVVNHNVHSLALHQHDEGMQRLYRSADAIFIDGMPVVGMARLTGGHVARIHRQGVLDWIWPFFAEAEAKGWVVTHLGSSSPTLDVARQRIADVHPELRLECLSGYFDHAPGSDGSRAVIDRINGLRTDVLLVGMGMPLQERWLAAHLHMLAVPTIVTVGGILGYIGGDRPTAPRWMGRIGIEWLYRLATEPSRLAHRYLVEPRVLLLPLVRATFGRPSRHAAR